jgi:hypothetical protein
VAIKTIWPITYVCGHSEDRDLSGKRADEWAGYARWLASKDCADCWRATQADAGGRLTKKQWLERKRAEEAEDVGVWEQRAGMFPLDGSEKAAAWGRRVRHAVLAGAYATLVAEGDMSDEQWIAHIGVPARLITGASWWIDNRDTTPGDVAELIAAAQPTSAVACENDA